MLHSLHKICGISLKLSSIRNVIVPSTQLYLPLDHSKVYASGCSSGSQYPGPISKKIEVKYKPYHPPCPMDHDSKNMKLRRPMSPHLTIYAPSIPTMTSICQRITGVILAFYTTIIASAAFLPEGLDTYVHFIWNLNLTPTQIFLFKFILGIAFPYHYLMGMRFAMWNAGMGLDLKTSYKTAYIALALFIPIAAMFAFI